MEGNGGEKLTELTVNNTPNFLVEGIITKRGKGWILVEENATTYKKRVNAKKEDGTFRRELITVNPYKLLICFSHELGEAYEKEGKFKDNENLYFTVQVSIDWNRLMKKVEPKYWLKNIYTVQEYIDHLKNSIDYSTTVEEEKPQRRI